MTFQLFAKYNTSRFLLFSKNNQTVIGFQLSRMEAQGRTLFSIVKKKQCTCVPGAIPDSTPRLDHLVSTPLREGYSLGSPLSSLLNKLKIITIEFFYFNSVQFLRWTRYFIISLPPTIITNPSRRFIFMESYMRDSGCGRK